MVIGAGAAGLVAAIAAAGGSAAVVLLEGTPDGGKKILISGGGRCNILPSVLAPDRFVTDSPPHLLRAMLRAWPLPQMVRFFEDEVGIPLALESETGKLFPRSNRSRDVRDGLLNLARQGGVRMQGNTRVHHVSQTETGWRVATTAGTVEASRVIVATGGLSVPKTGSDGVGLLVARATGHRVHEPYAALTPLTLDTRTDGSGGSAGIQPAELAGVSLPIRLRAKAAGRTMEASGGFLFTHRGYSGPAVLDVSHVCVRSGPGTRARLHVAWTPTPAPVWEERLATGDRSVATVLGAELPERLAAVLVRAAAVPSDRRTSSLTRAERHRMLELLVAGELPWSGHEGYAKAEVTGGGVALDEVNPRTLESRRAAGLYFCGEVLDAFGPIGGHNFAWAWSTGRAAGLAARASIDD